MRSNLFPQTVAGAAFLALAVAFSAFPQTAAPAASGIVAPATTTPANGAPASSTALTSAAGKVAVIEIQSAIFQTKDGQKALADMQAKFNPVKAKLDAKRADVAKNEDTLRKGQSTLSQDAQAKLARDIDVETKSLNRDTDDANADLEAENQKLMNDLGGKMMAIINKYAAEKGLVLVLDVSSQQTPVLWASNTIDITRDIIAAYDSGAATITPAPSSPLTMGPGRTTRPVSAPARPSSAITNQH